ncbi:PfkB family carbohydrate kinase, partial [Staphylococcus aureus]
ELIYRSSDEEIIKPVIPSNNVKDVTGAGDSFCAAVVYSWLNGMSTENILIAGMVNAKKTIETKYTVRQNLDQKQLYHDMEDYKNGEFTKVY